MNDEEARELIASIVKATLLAAIVLACRHWDHVRCWLPEFPRFHFQSTKQGPTPNEP